MDEQTGDWRLDVAPSGRVLGLLAAKPQRLDRPMTSDKRTRQAWSTLVAILVAGCGAEVALVDDDGSASSDGTGAGSAAGGASSVGGGAAEYDLQVGCAEVCGQACVGSPTLCNELCLEAAHGGCERESVELYACGLEYCEGLQDCTAQDDAVGTCLRRGGCDDPYDDSGYTYQCESAYGRACGETGCTNLDACECSGPCDDGHSATIACEIDWDAAEGERFDCKCFFDGELVGECFDKSESCLVETSCCRGWFAAD